MKIYNTKDALDWGKNDGILPHIKEINAPKDHTINNVKWGPLDESVYYCTDQGRLLHYDLEENSMSRVKDVHKDEIFTISITHDFTMLFTASKDGTCKLLHPETFDEIRSFYF